ncbi:phosphoribosylamine--glycine ligase [Bartonella sp. HY329]|uniref:phosphoribosylamine--glycine ligase n=1 Tax=unclassified Bartonella TaxID=2645622 RepID=UPI0021C5A8EA|nr:MULTISPECIES: phosphoribosylamine--glycine ligase [unclassified Bartonella]UXM95826.1 phosphoribosylamine--glycine ligase [Bartonella sp. HY329]UXN10151.1 phosphoribosylamine--glycine ligase [Bartonella sp. HY328]
MKILLIGSGGREHALAWKMTSSPLLEKLWCAPGNPGTAKIAENISLDISDHQAVIAFCKDNGVDLVMVGPEAPLVAGICDDLIAANIKVVGPTKQAAQLEGSKGFTKDICSRFDIPTASYGRFSDADSAKAYIRQQGAPIVVKADGLAAGKGVFVAMTLEDALNAIDACFDGAFGDAGAEVVVEEFLQGEEASFFCLCDGKNAIPFGTAQDHKRVGNGDTGPNTGGMGAYSPASIMSDELIAQTMREIIEPTMRGMIAIGAPFTGILYAGLMLTDHGPKLIEYNARFGDPECQVLMMLLQDDLIPLLEKAATGNLAGVTPKWANEAALTIVLAAEGYPDHPLKGTIIEGVEEAAKEKDVVIFHAGTALKDGKLIANGGRVLNVTAKGATVLEAQHKAYAAIDKINWPQGFCRQDIGYKEIARLKTHHQ